VRRYGAMRELVSTAVAEYASDVRSGNFPGKAELYGLKTG
jgi:ketopantoate hydroxymethyltransferase